MSCPLCGGPLGELGRLGPIVHYLCRDCGMQFHETGVPESEEDMLWEDEDEDALDLPEPTVGNHYL